MNGTGENDMAGLNEMYKKSKNEFDNTNGKSKKAMTSLYHTAMTERGTTLLRDYLKR